MKSKVYLDNAATTQVDEGVLEVMKPFFSESYGNASSLHSLGGAAKKSLEKARKVIADSIGAKSEEIVFTSGGTEGNNLALKGVAFANKDEGNQIVTTKVEHKCVLESCKWLEKQGFNVTYLDVNEEGFVKLAELEKAINEKTILVSVIHGNNEVGTINDLMKIGEVCRKKGIYFHTDACQSFTKTELNVKKMNLDLVTLNGHKIHGPKGVGALYVGEGVKLDSWQHGGFQENGLRAGTENVPGIVGFAEAVKLAMGSKHIVKMRKLRDKLIKGVLEKIPDVKINGPTGEKRLCNNIHFSFRFIEGEAIGASLGDKGISSSTGSACSERDLKPSYVLKALGLSHENMNGSLRLSLSRFTTEKEIDHVLKVLPRIVKRLREISPCGKEEEEHVF
ncbi:MAG: cysteine desulfurase [Nanoarchaeota archaeon]|nr:cysteine desulfurase [Nanoarchaeota archaeon]MBU1052147.1 cysteine desulfurase [Nanoarchaeota archaeon]MBU1988582.1 cysteine desulfurase [Nanoarchaeota archaeon]